MRRLITIASSSLHPVCGIQKLPLNFICWQGRVCRLFAVRSPASRGHLPGRGDGRNGALVANESGAAEEAEMGAR